MVVAFLSTQTDWVVPNPVSYVLMLALTGIALVAFLSLCKTFVHARLRRELHTRTIFFYAALSAVEVTIFSLAVNSSTMAAWAVVLLFAFEAIVITMRFQKADRMLSRAVIHALLVVGFFPVFSLSVYSLQQWLRG